MSLRNLIKGLLKQLGYRPHAEDDAFALAEDDVGGTTALDVLGNDLGGGAKSIVGLYAGPTLPFNLLPLQTSFVSGQTGATFSIGGDGKVHYDASTAFFDYQGLDDGDQLVETFTYIMRLGNGVFSVATATVTIAGANDAPVTADDAAVTDEDTAVNGTVVDNTTDPDDDPATELTYSVVGSTPVGLTFNADGTWSFDPSGQFDDLGEGDSVDVTFQYKANDGAADSNTSIVTITVNGVGGAPVATNEIDILFANFNETNIMFLNDGTGVFSGSKLPGPAKQSQGIALGDLDRDGDLDALVVNSSQANQILINDGNAGFTASDLAGGALISAEMALGDFDGDEWLDIIVANWGHANQILINDGAGGFEAAVDLPGGTRSSNRVAVGDVNGDGHLDALISNSGEINQVMINDGTGSFVASDLVGGAQTTMDIALGDVDGDGDLDALVANFGQPNQLLLNDGDGDFSLAASDLPGGSMQSRDIAVGDVDDDGDMDALVANNGQPNQLLRNDGAGNFTVSLLPEPAIFASASQAIALGDLDGDGDLDAVVATFQGFNYRLINDGSGAFVVATFPSVDSSATFNSVRIGLGDLDGDGAAAPVDAYGLPNLDPFGLLPDIHVI